MARSSYRNFMRLLEKWPVDETKKGGRDLGEHLRAKVSESFSRGEATAVNEPECARVYASLHRLAANVYARQYPRTLTSTSTGLSTEQCKQVVSTQFLEALQEEEEGFFSRWFKKK